MNRTIVLSFPDEALHARAELLEREAPRTCATIWERLPVVGTGIHGIYSGSEVFVPLSPPLTLELEHATTEVRPGDVAFTWFKGGTYEGIPDDVSQILWFYDKGRPAVWEGLVPVTVFARIADAGAFFQSCRRIRIEGAKRVVVSRG